MNLCTRVQILAVKYKRRAQDVLRDYVTIKETAHSKGYAPNNNHILRSLEKGYKRGAKND